MRISFHGGVGEVTGSRHLLETDGLRILLDCGLFQGHRRESIEKNGRFGFAPDQVQAVLLSHAHVDHCGSLPLLAKSGFRGRIHCTPPTADLCEIMLMDSARLQAEDAKFFNKIHQQDGQYIEPLYAEEDVRLALKLFAPHPYEEWFWLKDHVRSRFLNAGHVLGSAMIEVEAGADGAMRRLVYTGDLGRRVSLLMEPPRIPASVDYLLIESTYGGRLHEPVLQAEAAFADLIQTVVEEKGKLLIPSFALERTQEIVFILEKLRRQKRIPPIPFFVDSPMAVNITEIFERYRDYFSAEFRADAARSGDPFGFDSIHYIRTPEDSRRLNDRPGPMVILSASGMCEGGRILHHLRNNIGRVNTTILLVGYQAEGTLGRRLGENAKKVRIFGLEHPVVAQVRSMHFFSAHADQNDLLGFIQRLDPRPRRIFLVHGDEDDRDALAGRLQAEGIKRVEQPSFGDSFNLE